MPAGIQSDPPNLEHIAPKWFHTFWDKIRAWMIGNRPVPGIGITISDAPGGGAQISCNVTQVARAISANKLAFYWYPSPYTGGGDPPANQGLKIRLRPGTVNSIPPSNMNVEFTLTNGTNYVKIQTTNDDSGFATSCAIIADNDPPDVDPPGSLNVAPATSTRTLWTFEAADNKITDDTAGRVGDLDMTPFAYKLACGGGYVKLFWSGTTVLPAG